MVSLATTTMKWPSLVHWTVTVERKENVVKRIHSFKSIFLLRNKLIADINNASMSFVTPTIALIFFCLVPQRIQNIM